MELKIQIFLTLFAVSCWNLVFNWHLSLDINERDNKLFFATSISALISFLVVVWSL
jgi:hypothetical protein